MPKKKPQWGKGTVFLVPLQNEQCGVGQVITNEVMGSPTVAVFPMCLPCDSELAVVPPLQESGCIALLTLLGGYALDKGLWRLLGNRELALNSSRGENWKHRGRQWVGASLLTDNIVEALLNAYHGLEPWDNFADPEFLDKLLLPPHKRPDGVKLIKSN